MSLLDIVQDATSEIGIVSPNQVVGNTDQQIKQLLQLANAEGKRLARRYRWQVLQKEATFTTVATASQGNINDIASDGFNYVLNDTIWNRDTRRPVFGPLAPRDWQMLQASPITGPFDQYRIRGDLLLFDPSPSAGEDCAFEYISKHWCEDTDGTGQEEWGADDDVGRLDEDLMTLGLIWRWKKAKGFEYAEDFAEYEALVADAMARDGSKATGDLGGGITDFQPGIFVPQTGYNQ